MRSRKRLLPVLTLAMGALLLVACQRGESDKALLEAPAVGDLYAAQLSAFSEFEFTDDAQQPIDPAYGLMQVVSADTAGVVVITENAAAGEQSVARSDLRGDQAEIVFDESERIQIPKADLLKAHEDGLIFGVRRPDAK